MSIATNIFNCNICLFVFNQCGTASSTKVWWSIPLIDHVDPVAPVSESGLLLHNCTSGFSSEPSNIPAKHESFIMLTSCFTFHFGGKSRRYLWNICALHSKSSEHYCNITYLTFFRKKSSSLRRLVKSILPSLRCVKTWLT